MSKKLDKADWSKIVGMPDAWDKKNIANLVETFNKTTFTIPTTDDPEGPTVETTGAQWIKSTVAEARERHQLNDLSNEFGVKSKALEMRVLTSVPRPLYMKLLEGYPTLFKDVKQHIWFAKNFPMFRLPRKL